MQPPVPTDVAPIRSADKLLSSLRAQKLKLTQEQARLKPKLKSTTKVEEQVAKSYAAIPAGQ